MCEDCRFWFPEYETEDMWTYGKCKNDKSMFHDEIMKCDEKCEDEE